MGHYLRHLVVNESTTLSITTILLTRLDPLPRIDRQHPRDQILCIGRHIFRQIEPSLSDLVK
jgi:hypothetical protein